MGVNKQLAVSGYLVLHLAYVFYCYLIARIRNGGMAVLLLFEFSHLTLLVGQEDNLVVDYGFHIWNAVNFRKQVFGHDTVVDNCVTIWTQRTWQSNIVNIEKTVDFHMTVAHAYLFIVHLEVAHRYCGVGKVHSKESVGIFPAFLGLEESATYLLTFQTVGNLLYLHKEVSPLVVVVSAESSALSLLCYYYIGDGLCVGASIEETEIGI